MLKFNIDKTRLDYTEPTLSALILPHLILISYLLLSFLISGLLPSPISGKMDYLGADLLFPLFVGVIVHAALPSVHIILVRV